MNTERENIEPICNAKILKREKDRMMDLARNKTLTKDKDLKKDSDGGRKKGT